jgi:hypothetical protein
MSDADLAAFLAFFAVRFSIKVLPGFFRLAFWGDLLAMVSSSWGLPGYGRRGGRVPAPSVRVDRCDVEPAAFGLPDLFRSAICVVKAGRDGGEDVSGVDEVAGGGGEQHRGVGRAGVGIRGHDQQVDAVTVVAQRGQQGRGLAGEVAKPHYAPSHVQTAGLFIPASGAEDQSDDRSPERVDREDETRQLSDGVGGAGPPAAVEQSAAGAAGLES